MKGSRLSWQKANELFEYDADSGRLLWKIRKKGIRPGQVAGGGVNGVMYVTVDWVRYLVKDVAWLLHTGVWPKSRVYHVNGDRRDFRPDNLSYQRGVADRDFREFKVVQHGDYVKLVINGRVLATFGPDETERLIDIFASLIRYR